MFTSKSALKKKSQAIETEAPNGDIAADAEGAPLEGTFNANVDKIPIHTANTSRNTRKQQLLANGIEFFEDIGALSSLLQAKNEDFLNLFVQKILGEEKLQESRPNEALAMAVLISKVVKKGDSFMQVQQRLLTHLESMLEWCFVLLENDPRDQTYTRLAHQRVKMERFQEMWVVSMTALMRLLTCRENHIPMESNKNISVQIRRCIALISNVFLLEEDAIFKTHMDTSTDESGKTVYPITVQSFQKVIPVMHVYTMKLAGALMLTFRSALMPYAGILHDLCEQLLRTFHIQQANESIEVHTFERYRETMRFVEIFCEIFGNASFDLITRTLLPILSKNVVPFHRALQMWNSNYLEEKKKLLESISAKNKRRKRKDNEDMQEALRESPLQTTCLEASVLLRSTFVTVETLSTIFAHCKQQITRHNQIEAYTNISDIVTRTLHILTLWHEQYNLTTRVLHKNVLQLERTCPVVASLYRLLRNVLLCINAAEASSPFMNQSLQLFREGRQQDTSREVSNVCHEALLVMDAFIHPRAKPLFIPHAESIEVLYESMRENVKRHHVDTVIDKFDEENVRRRVQVSATVEKTSNGDEAEKNGDAMENEDAVEEHQEEIVQQDDETVAVAAQKHEESIVEETPAATESSSKKRKPEEPTPSPARPAKKAKLSNDDNTEARKRLTEQDDDASSVDVDMDGGPDNDDELSDMDFD